MMVLFVPIMSQHVTVIGLPYMKLLRQRTFNALNKCTFLIGGDYVDILINYFTNIKINGEVLVLLCYIWVQCHFFF